MSPDLPIKVIVRDDCPPETVYVLDPGALPDLMLPADELRKAIITGDEELAERIRAAARRVGCIDNLGASLADAPPTDREERC